MSLHHPTPAHLRLLIDEVRYLHALWHHGNPNPNPRPPLGPTTRPSFKKTPKNHTSNKKINKIRDKINTKNHTAAAAEWAVPPDPDPAPAPGPTGWAMWPILPPALLSLNAPEDLAWIASVKAQDDALTACDDFFVPKDGSTITSDDDMEEEDVGELGVRKFFSGLFQSDENLREYYKKNCNDGYFHCLVCWGIGKKGRRYPNCVGLVQHAKSVTKTKLQLAHREFAKVVCEVLGWDINKLPSVVLDLAEPLGETIGKDDQTQEDAAFDDKQESLKEVGESVEIPSDGINIRDKGNNKYKVSNVPLLLACSRVDTPIPKWVSRYKKLWTSAVTKFFISQSTGQH